MTQAGGRDLLFQDEIREAVRRSYQGLPAGAGRLVAERLYAPEELAVVPEPAVAWALGVGNPVRHAALGEGETVLDIGCGGGLDSVLAAVQVGPGGQVIGLDMLAEMCERARVAADEAGVGGWCRFEQGEMEAIPLPDGSVDVAISNGVINLSPRKARALAEVARVLAPGGRLCFADLTVDDELPPEVLASEAAWAGCIAGAVSEGLLAKKLQRAGLTKVEISHRVPFSLDDVAAYPLFTAEIIELMRRRLPAAARSRVATGLIVTATKPADPGAATVAVSEAELAARAANGQPQAAPPAAARTARLEDIAAEPAEAPGVTVRHLKRVEDVELKVLDVEPGGATPWHVHGHAHEGVVVSGTGALRLEGGRQRLAAGHVFSVAPGARHALVNEGAEALRFVCMDCFVE